MTWVIIISVNLHPAINVQLGQKCCNTKILNSGYSSDFVPVLHLETEFGMYKMTPT